MKKLAEFLIVIALIILVGSTYLYFTSFYTVTFVTDGTALKKNIKRGDSVLDVYKPSKNGYTFLYWMDDYTIVDNSYKLDHNTVLVAIFDKIVVANRYTVKFDTDGGSIIEDQIVTEGDTIVEPDVPTKTGYVFKEWKLEDNSYDFNTEVKSNITLKATYIKQNVQRYTVRFDTDGGSNINNRVVEIGGTVTKPANPVKEGYTFKEWHLNGVKYNFSTPVTKNITLVAVYTADERKVYTIKFDTKGGSTIPNQSVKDGDKVMLPEAPTKEGYVFVNWVYDNNKYDFNTKVKSDMTLEAVYISNASNVNAYVVSFDTDGGPNIPIQLITEGGKVVKPGNPTKAGYTFVSWTYNGEEYNFSAPVKNTMTLHALYKKNEEPAPTPEPVPTPEPTPEPTPTPEPEQPIVKTYTIKFNTDGGSKISDLVVNENDLVTKPDDPIKEGYTFDKWIYNGVEYNFNAPVTANLTLKATYVKNEPVEETPEEPVEEVTQKYTLSFDPNGGTVSKTSKVVTYNQKVGDLPVPERDGFIFKGWYNKLYATGYLEEGQQAPTSPFDSFSVIQITKDTIYDIEKNVTIVAMWEENE